MRKELSTRIKRNLNGYLEKIRYDMNITQEQMSELLMMDKRSYAELAHNNALPSFVSFILIMSLLDTVEQQKLLDRLLSVVDSVKSDENL